MTKKMKCRKEIVYCEQRTEVWCDGQCSKVVGNNPPKEATWEGTNMERWSPDNYKNFPNRWCVRECDRCHMLSFKEAIRKFGRGK